MKKKIFAILIVTVVATFAGYNVYQSQSAGAMSDLLQANVEALATREGGGDKGILYGTKPDSQGQCYYCCCPGDNNCGAVACSGC